MTFSDILAIIGIIITIFFSVWGILIAIRKRYPGRITFVEENAIGLFNSIIKNFPDIKIQYDNKPISEQMVYLKASFINTGSIDLSTKGNSHKLKINLSDDYKWISCKLTDVSKDVICELKNLENELIFDFDLLRKNEFIQFEAFAEIKNTDKPASTFRKSLVFSHRIPNTAKTDKLPYLNEEQINDKRSEFKKNLIFATIFLVLIIAFTSYRYFTKSADLEYKFIENKKEYNVKISPIDSANIKLEDSDKDYEKTLGLNEINSSSNLKMIIKQPTLLDLIKKLSYIFLYIFMYAFFMLKEISDIYKDKKIKKIIEKK